MTYKGEAAKNMAIRESFHLVKQIKDEETSIFVLSGMLVFTDKIINLALAREIKEWLRMTQVGRLFEEEKLEAVRAGKQAGKQEGKQEGKLEGKLEEQIRIAKSLLDVLNDEIIAKKTGLTLEQVKQLKSLV